MNIVYYIPTYNRPKILQECLSSLFANTKIIPNECWIVDDGSVDQIKIDLLNFSIQNSHAFPINLILNAKNYGVSYSFEKIYNLIKQNDDVDIACIVESDYIWRKGWLEDVVSVFNASENTITIAGTDHPDMYDKNRTHGFFPQIMNDFFGSDLESRKFLYNPFVLKTNNGDIKVQGVSNSCGCLIIHVKRLKKVIKELEENGIVPINDFWDRMNKAFHKNTNAATRKTVHDGWMSTTLSKYGELYLKYLNQDITKTFPMLSICDYSISEHVCGDGLNGKIVPEGQTFVNSPSWKNDYLLTNPRQ